LLARLELLKTMLAAPPHQPNYKQPGGGATTVQSQTNNQVQIGLFDFLRLAIHAQHIIQTKHISDGGAKQERVHHSPVGIWEYLSPVNKE